MNPLIEIDEITEILGISRTKVYQKMRLIPYAIKKPVNGKWKRYWDRELILDTIERNRPVVEVTIGDIPPFPSNHGIREFLIKSRGIARYRAYA